ncbi:MAG: hypothetical protein J6A79_06625 [Clostridia bacterium]|nr:hypothetical protein [Clostridia bacterium]
MTAKQLIEMALAYSGKTQKDLALVLNWSPQLLNNRLKTGKFTIEEWNAIAKALDAELILAFKFPDGRVV